MGYENVDRGDQRIENGISTSGVVSLNGNTRVNRDYVNVRQQQVELDENREQDTNHMRNEIRIGNYDERISEEVKMCNCRNKAECPLANQCLRPDPHFWARQCLRYFLKYFHQYTQTYVCVCIYIYKRNSFHLPNFTHKALVNPRLW